MKTLRIKLCMSYSMFEFLTFFWDYNISIFFSLWSHQILEDLELLFWFPTELCLIHNKSTNKLPTHSFFDAQTLTNAPGGKSVTVIVDLLLYYKIKCIYESCFFISTLKYYEYFTAIMKICIYNTLYDIKKDNFEMNLKYDSHI